MNKLTQAKCISLSVLFSLISSCSTLTTSPQTGNNSMTDIEITTNVQTRINAEKGLGDNNVQASTFERVVTLNGTVQNYTQADVAYMLACTTPGVTRVISKLSVTPVHKYEAKGQWWD